MTHRFEFDVERIADAIFRDADARERILGAYRVDMSPTDPLQCARLVVASMDQDHPRPFETASPDDV